MLINGIDTDLIVMAIWGVIFAIFVLKLFQSICLVPTKSAYIVERLGKYHSTLDAGFHALIPFLDKVAYIHDLKEETIDVPPQECFSSDEVNVEVDGVIYISVTDPVKASYGITDYRYAAIQLAQTTTRSVIGTLDLDRTFEERDVISAKVVEVLDEAGSMWGIRVHRYEIKNITPPETVKNAMEMQVNAERERRALLAKSEGDKQSKINRSEGVMAETINRSEGEMQRRINEAEGKAQEILTLAKATAESIERLAVVISSEGGQSALRMQLGEQYMKQLDGLSKPDSRIVLPGNLVNFEYWMQSIGLKDDKK
ncbi:SPFH domain-containing protein [Shewanella frigidimarina]|jgi:regulator of protease activity HflC (stomatin/prohibitin superfamily)|uniref:SPFH domain, Band 7 family protein n=1 Tax=Shewanella frigidimarina (strain NCIMB 400) TaxID=318167 RepID=Q07XM9_SHEFN|nr:SPFH domain, Band 7 family protein [Shewanella frigidimarina NCIMB 400]PKI06651.1 paraslipin [Shewanella sp. 11B5]RPA30692.1 paraslipin [Shewanella frigidimarina]RPA64333.1 paraslipin [Shewanella frigidimarina]HBF47453.1 paraslipin [Shewanella frigidimarina]|tara:strand:+ start:7617 stop:8555 length:939 start_codon:yes stop_codon:yes gene_type:complete